MTLFDDINAAWKEAMKAKDPRKDALAGIRTEVKNKIINSRGGGAAEAVPDDELVLEVLVKMAKQRKESIAEFEKGGRDDLVANEAAELAVIETYLPKGLTDDEVDALVTAAIAEAGATSAKDMGKVMKIVLQNAGGRADGKVVQGLVREKLGS